MLDNPKHYDLLVNKYGAPLPKCHIVKYFKGTSETFENCKVTILNTISCFDLLNTTKHRLFFCLTDKTKQILKIQSWDENVNFLDDGSFNDGTI